MKWSLPLVAVLLANAASAASINLTNDTSGYVVKWPTTQVSYYLDKDGTSDIADGSDLAAVRKAIASWNNVSCSAFTFVEAATTTSTHNVITERATDGKNALVWVEDSRWQFGSYVLGVTSPVFNSYGQIDEADIAFNGYATTWATNGSSYSTDVESVAVHELGHFFGLQHALGGQYLSDPPTMSPTVDPHLKTRTLTADDETGICFLYPQTSFGCSVNADCPKVVVTDNYGTESYAGQLPCSQNKCSGFEELEPGTNEVGESCAGDHDCKPGTFCQPYGYNAYCSDDCTPGADTCPNGTSCVAYSNSSGGACLPSVGGGSGDGQLGEMCSSNTDCQSGLHCQPSPSGTFCSQNCEPSNASSCPSGFDCLGYSNAPGGACVPNGEPSGGGGSGNPGGTPQGGAACACDSTFSCDASCECDPECAGSVTACLCDKTTACDGDCACDPECQEGGICSATLGQRGRGSSSLLTLLAVSALLGLRRRKIQRT